MVGPETLERRGKRLEYGTTVWNSLEAVVAITSGVTSHSLALVAFGLDSCVEVLASLVVLWHLGGDGEDAAPRRAQRAMRLIAITFGVLGVYLAGQAVHGLLSRKASEPSDVGTAFMAATVAVMFFLAWHKRRTGVALRNRPLVANASMTLIDGCLAVGVLAALAAQRLLGWWWSDPLAAGVVAVIALNEARQNWTSRPATGGSIGPTVAPGAHPGPLLDAPDETSAEQLRRRTPPSPANPYHHARPLCQRCGAAFDPRFNCRTCGSPGPDTRPGRAAEASGE